MSETDIFVGGGPTHTELHLLFRDQEGAQEIVMSPEGAEELASLLQGAATRVRSVRLRRVQMHGEIWGDEP